MVSQEIDISSRLTISIKVIFFNGMMYKMMIKKHRVPTSLLCQWGKLLLLFTLG